MRWSAALLLVLTAIIALPLCAQIAQNHAASREHSRTPSSADEMFDKLIHRITACKMGPGDGQVSRIACLFEQVHCERRVFLCLAALIADEAGCLRRLGRMSSQTAIPIHLATRCLHLNRFLGTWTDYNSGCGGSFQSRVKRRASSRANQVYIQMESHSEGQTDPHPQAKRPHP